MRHETVETGKLITFEGGEGAGKSTQVAILVERLRTAGRHAIATREPGGSPAAEEIRETLLSGKVKQFGIAIKLSDTPGSVRTAAPFPGEQTDEVLKELGMTAEAIHVLRTQKVIE